MGKSLQNHLESRLVFVLEQTIVFTQGFSLSFSFYYNRLRYLHFTTNHFSQLFSVKYFIFSLILLSLIVKKFFFPHRRHKSCLTNVILNGQWNNIIRLFSLDAPVEDECIPGIRNSPCHKLSFLKRIRRSFGR